MRARCDSMSARHTANAAMHSCARAALCFKGSFYDKGSFYVTFDVFHSAEEQITGRVERVLIFGKGANRARAVRLDEREAHGKRREAFVCARSPQAFKRRAAPACAFFSHNASIHQF